jgi:uncharacterized protein YecT (DUF1311 family)
MRMYVVKSSLTLGLFLLTAMSSPVFAQWSPPTACDRFGGYEAQSCLSGEISQADGKLNEAYRRAQAVIAADPQTPTDQKATWQDNLTKAQRAWITFRDADCLFELIGAEWHNGSGTTAAQQACVLDKTQRRTKELLDRYTSN